MPVYSFFPELSCILSLEMGKVNSYIYTHNESIKGSMPKMALKIGSKVGYNRKVQLIFIRNLIGLTVTKISKVYLYGCL